MTDTPLPSVREARPPLFVLDAETGMRLNLDAMLDAAREEGRREERGKLLVVGYVPEDDSGQPWLLHADYSREAVLTDKEAMAHCKERNVFPLYRHADD